MRRLLVASSMIVVSLSGQAAAQTDAVTIRVDGLSCPFCAYSLEKKLRSVEGVAELTIDFEDAVAAIDPAGEARLDFAALSRAVADAGFTAREIRARGAGRVHRDEQARVTLGTGGTPLFRVDRNELADGLETNAWITFEGVVHVALSDSLAVPGLSLTAATPMPRNEEG